MAALWETEKTPKVVWTRHQKRRELHDKNFPQIWSRRKLIQWPSEEAVAEQDKGGLGTESLILKKEVANSSRTSRPRTIVRIMLGRRIL